jgi:hypothetical protein
MGFPRVREYVDAELVDGNICWSSFRKAISQVTTQGLWFDMSMSPGNPSPQYYPAAPLVAVQMKYSTDGGLYHGRPVGIKEKFLKEFCIHSTSATGLPLPFIMMDYLLFYPFIDQGSADQQDLTNDATLPRFEDGDGVQVMCVNVAAGAGGQTFSFTYTNSEGVSGRTSQVMLLNTGTAIGTIATSSLIGNATSGPFCGLQIGDKGVRSIQSVTMISGTDVGLFTLVLVKPMVSLQLYEQTAPAEKNLYKDQTRFERIYDDAYLNFICCPNGSLTGVAFNGYIETIWR